MAVRSARAALAEALQPAATRRTHTSAKVWPFSMCRSHFTSRAIAGDSTNVNALARSNLRITFFLVDRGELVSIEPMGRLRAEAAGSERWALDFFAAIQHHIRKLSNDRLGVCGVLHRLPLKSACETFDGDIAAGIAGAAFTCDDEDLSSISRALMARRRERSPAGRRVSSSGSPPARATNHCRSPAILQVGDDPLSKTSFRKAV